MGHSDLKWSKFGNLDIFRPQKYDTLTHGNNDDVNDNHRERETGDCAAAKYLRQVIITLISRICTDFILSSSLPYFFGLK